MLWTMAVAANAAPVLSHVLTMLLSTLMANRNRPLRPPRPSISVESVKAPAVMYALRFARAYGPAKTI